MKGKGEREKAELVNSCHGLFALASRFHYFKKKKKYLGSHSGLHSSLQQSRMSLNILGWAGAVGSMMLGTERKEGVLAIGTT